MKNTLAENLLRFGAKNLTKAEKTNLSKIAEQAILPPDAGFNEAALFQTLVAPTLKVGYNFVATKFNTARNTNPNSNNDINIWEKTHVLTDGTNSLIYGMESVPIDAKGNHGPYKPSFAGVSTNTSLETPLGDFTFENIIYQAIAKISADGIKLGLQQFIMNTKVPQPSQPVSSAMIQSIAKKYNIIAQYNNKVNAINQALKIS